MSNVTCSGSVSQAVLNKVNYIVYEFGAPAYFVIGLFGHTLLLLALYHQAKVQPAYMYQVYRAVFGTVLIGTRSLYCLNTVFLQADTTAGFINTCYACVWYYAHLSPPLTNSIISTSLLLSVSMVGDRVLALHNPILYRSLNQKWYQIIAVIVSVSLSFSASAFDVFRKRVENGKTNGTYASVNNDAWTNSTTAYALALCRATLLAASLCALIGLSVVLVFLYRASFVKKIKEMTNDAKQEKRKQREKTVTLLTLLECSFNVAGVSMLVANNVLIYGFPTVYSCLKIWVPLLDFTMMITDVADFYTAVVLSKQFRQMLRKALAIKGMCAKGNTVTPLSGL